MVEMGKCSVALSLSSSESSMHVSLSCCIGCPTITRFEVRQKASEERENNLPAALLEQTEGLLDEFWAQGYIS